MAGPSSLEQSPLTPAATDLAAYLPTIPGRVTANLTGFVDELALGGGLEQPFSNSFRHMLLNEEAHRVRPVLTYVAALACDLEPRSVDDYAMAMEMLHTMSLVLDDLPAQDNSSERRHQPTLHLALGESNAQNTPPQMTGRAFQLILRAGQQHGSDVEALFDYVNTGLTRMAVGQEMDLALKGRSDKNVTPMELDEIAGRKTATAIEMCLVGVAMLKGLPPEVINNLKRYSRYYGLAFQIQDDLIDGRDGPNGSGKTTGLDRRNRKPNYLSVLAAGGAQRRFEYYRDRAAAIAVGHLTPALGSTNFEKMAGVTTATPSVNRAG